MVILSLFTLTTNLSLKITVTDVLCLFATMGSHSNYSITHHRGCDNGNADVLSRLPIMDSPSVVPIPGDVLQTIEHFSSTPITADKIKIWTSQDPHLSQVLCYVQHGWPVSVEDVLAPFARRRLEMDAFSGEVVW